MASLNRKIEDLLRVETGEHVEGTLWEDRALHSVWSKARLHELVTGKLAGYPFVVVSNRQPYAHVYSGKEVVCQTPAGGLTAALDPMMQICGGTWIAHGSGNADRTVVDARNKVEVPPEDPRYSLKRVWLTKGQEEGYYHGFSNQALWPLCHVVHNMPVFSQSHWNTYRDVNEIFAENVLDEVGGGRAFVFIQDYHLALLPRLIKKGNPNIVTAQFWHIPWPNPELFRICPWREEILDGLLGNDLLGFQIRDYCHNFLDTVGLLLRAKVDRKACEVKKGKSRTAVRFFPISVDFREISLEAQRDEVAEEMERLRGQLGLSDQFVGFGLDRQDYTKGIPQRFLAIDRFFQKYPRYKGRMTFIQASAPSRVDLDGYKRLDGEIESLIDEVNSKYDWGYWRPIVHLKNKLPLLTLMALMRMANFCVVSALHDGMNLVAKEFVASRFDEDGVLILSPFAGAAAELSDAILVNPYATDRLAEAMKQALEMPKHERQRRMQRMREIVAENDIYKWAVDIVSELVKLAPETQ